MSKVILIHYAMRSPYTGEMITNRITHMLEVSREELTAIILGDLERASAFLICEDSVYTRFPSNLWTRREVHISWRGGETEIRAGLRAHQFSSLID